MYKLSSSKLFCWKSHWCLELFTTHSQLFFSILIQEITEEYGFYTLYEMFCIGLLLFLCVFIDFIIWFYFNLFQLLCYSHVCVFSLEKLL